MPLLSSVTTALRRRRVLPRWVRATDRRAAARRNATAYPRRFDAALRWLSARADRGVLWFAVAAVLSLSGRRGRRAAVRGLVSLGLASAVANLIGKRLFGGERPVLADVPVTRQLSKPPSSPSFPSGHSASASAFVTGVAFESPAAAVTLAPVAAAVAYSRLHTGSHWLSDVVGGIGIGAAVAAVGRLLAPPDPTGPAGEPLDLPPLPRGAGLFIVLNPTSGSGSLRIVHPELLRRALPDATVYELKRGERVSVVLQRAIARHRPVAIGACGGDGTIGVAAGVALEHDLPFVAIPGGTLNHFARAAGIFTVRAAVRSARKGTGIRARVARARVDDGAEFTVLNTASVGIYPQLVAEREKLEGRIGKWPGAVVAATRILPDVAPVRFTSPRRSVEAWLAFIGVNRYFPKTIIPRRRRSVDDGVLDVRIARSDVAASRFRVLTNLVLGGRLSGALRRVPPLGRLLGVDTFTATTLDFRVDERPDAGGFAHDGEVVAPASSYRVRIAIDERPLRLYAPLRR